MAHSALVIHVDTVNKTLSAQGSFSGAHATSGASQHFNIYHLPDSTGAPAIFGGVLNSLFTPTLNGLAGVVLNFDSNNARIQILANPTAYGTPFSFDGNGSTLSYASNANADSFVDLIGMELAYVGNGSSSDVIRFTGTIPEPSTYAAIASASILALVAFRRIRRKA